MPLEPINPSTNLLKLSAAIDELVNEATAAIEGLKLPPGSINNRKRYALAAITAATGHAVSVKELAVLYQADSAFIVLRALVECYIQVSYALLGEGEEHLLTSLLKNYSDDIKRYGHLKKYVEEHTTNIANEKEFIRNLANGIEMLEEAKNSFIEELTGVDSNVDFKKIDNLSLIKQAEEHDEVTGGELTLTYRMVYFHLSQYTHTSALYLGGVIKEDSGSISLNSENPDYAAQMSIHSAYAVYADVFLKVASELGIATEGMVEKFQEKARTTLPKKG